LNTATFIEHLTKKYLNLCAIQAEMQQTTKEVIIILTEKAASKAKLLLEKENKQGYGLRVGITAGGCSSYMYEIGFEKAPKEHDMVIEEKGIRVFINPQSVSFIRGSTVDYIDSLTNAGFRINNPNVRTTCGCGHSVG